MGTDPHRLRLAPRNLHRWFGWAKGEFRPHRYALLPAAVVLAAFIWMVTCGSGDLLGKEAFGSFYDAQARSLFAGRWDVPRNAIRDEAFLRDGKVYGYFGFAPALLHMPFAVLWPESDGRWSRLSETAACCVTLWYAYQLLLRARSAFGLPDELDRRSKVLYSLLLISFGLGSSLIFMASEAYVFHEAIIWGAAFSLAGYDYLGRYFITGRSGCLIGACVLGFLAFFSRGSVGAGPIVALALTAVALATRTLPRQTRFNNSNDLHAGAKRRQESPQVQQIQRRNAPDSARASDSGAARRCGYRDTGSLWRRLAGAWRSLEPARPPWHAGVAAGAVALTLAVFVAINYAKFRTFLDAAPLRLYSQMQSNPRRLQRVAGRQVSLANVHSGALAYFSPARIRFQPAFPWVFATRDARIFAEARYDLIEPYASLPATNPAACGLALAGVIGAAWLARRRHILWPFILTVGALAGAAAPLAADALTFRYLHDMFPFLVVAGAFGLHALLLLPRIARRTAFSLLLPAVLFGTWANLAIAIVYQRAIVNGTPGESRREFKAWQQYIDRHLSGRP